MTANIITLEDLYQFKTELIHELKLMISISTELNQKRWLRSDEVRKLLKLSSGTLQTLRLNGTLTYTKLGGTLYYDYEQIAELLQRNLIEARF